jgi:rRNA maturation endonuclease Nob1
MERRLVFDVLGYFWIAYSLYFVISNVERSKILCPGCEKQFDGPRWRHDKCQHCGLAAWSPVPDHQTTGVVQLQ